MARTSTKKKPAPLDPSLVLERVAPGVDYWAVTLHGERIGDVRGTEAGTPGLAERIGQSHKTRTEAANAVLRRYLTRPVPASCRWCRREENTYLLGQNHGGEHGVHWGHCMAQALRRNHLSYALDRDDLDRIAEYLALAAELWQHMPPEQRPWLDEARSTLQRRREQQAPPEHTKVLVAAEDGALW